MRCSRQVTLGELRGFARVPVMQHFRVGHGDGQLGGRFAKRVTVEETQLEDAALALRQRPRIRAARSLASRSSGAAFPSVSATWRSGTVISRPRIRRQHGLRRCQQLRTNLPGRRRRAQDRNAATNTCDVRSSASGRFPTLPKTSRWMLCDVVLVIASHPARFVGAEVFAQASVCADGSRTVLSRRCSIRLSGEQPPAETKRARPPARRAPVVALLAEADPSIPDQRGISRRTSR